MKKAIVYDRVKERILSSLWLLAADIQAEHGCLWWEARSLVFAISEDIRSNNELRKIIFSPPENPRQLPKRNVLERKYEACD